MKLSPAMRSVLKACIDAPPVRQGIEEERQILHHHCVPVRRLVDQRVREGASVGVARASISRTLHRLFRQGLVDLQKNHGQSFTERLADPELTEHEREARGRSGMRATWIQATDDGLRAVNCYSNNS